MSLTNAACANAKARAKPYKVADGRGLYLEVMPNGSKYWRLKYRFAGKEKRLAIGVYPAVSLAAARDKRNAAREQLAELIDPGAVKRAQKARMALSAATTVEVVAREWHELNKEKWTPDYRQDVLHRLEVDIFPQLGSLPVAEVRPIQLLNALRKIEDRGANELARRTLQYCGQIFRYAIVTERADRDISADLKGALRPCQRGHFAALDADELPAFLQTLARNEARLFTHTRHAIELLMLTFVRTSELIEASWNEIDLETAEWVIPAERMKMRLPHIVPLSRQALAILRKQNEMTGNWAWIFPNQVEPRRCMSNNTILKALKRLGYKGRMTGHGFRALAMSTIKEKLGYRHEVVDRQLAHAPRSKVEAAYDRAAFLDERRRMMQDWADYLEQLANSGRPNGSGLPRHRELAIREWRRPANTLAPCDQPLPH